MPTFNIDLAAKDASLQLHAIMFWPHSATARENYLVTAAAQVKHDADELPLLAEEASKSMIRDVQAAGFAVNPVAIKTQAQEQARALVSSVHAEIDTDVLRPSGGYERLVHSPGIDAIHAARDDAAKKGRACGEILWNIVTLDKRHHGE